MFLATIGHLDDPVLIRRGRGTILSRDARGRTYAVDAGVQDPDLILYGQDGAVVRTVGRTGDGPGEFQSILDLMVGPGDSLFVLDRVRVTVFDSAGTYVRTVPIEHPMMLMGRFVDITPEALILTAWYRSLGLSDFPFHRFAHDGSYRGSFGPAGTVRRVDEEQGLDVPMARPAAVEPAGTRIWFIEPGVGYRIDALGPSGDVERRIAVRSREWRGMRPLLLTEADARSQREETLSQPRAAPDGPVEWRMSLPEGPSGPPTSSSVQGFFVVDEHTLLVLIRVPGRHWERDRYEWDLTFPSEPRLIPGSTLWQFDTVIDILDIRTGELLARSEFEGGFRLLKDGTLARLRMSELGVFSFDLYALEIALDGAGS